MTTIKHSELELNNVHAPHTFEYLTENDRISATGFKLTDIGKIAFQKSDNTHQLLKNNNPAEQASFGGGGVSGIGQNTFQNVGQNDEVVASHGIDTFSARIVQIAEYVPGASLVNSSLDFDLGDESKFVQEDAATGTDFKAGALTLHNKNLSPISYIDVCNGAGVLSSSGSQSGYTPDRAFNRSALNNYQYTQMYNTQQVEFDLGQPRHIRKLTSVAYSGMLSSSRPGYGYKFEVSNDRVNQVELGYEYNATPALYPDFTRLFNVNGYYRYCKLSYYVTSSQAALGIEEIYVYEEIPDITINEFKWVSMDNGAAIDLSNIITLTSIDMSGVRVPPECFCQVCLTLDGELYRQNGATLSVVPGTDYKDRLAASGNTVAEIQSIVNIDVSSFNTLGFAFLMKTTLSSKTPVIDQINVTVIEKGTYKTAQPGDYTASFISPTQTKVKKLSTGICASIKVNVLI